MEKIPYPEKSLIMAPTRPPVYVPMDYRLKVSTKSEENEEESDEAMAHQISFVADSENTFITL